MSGLSSLLQMASIKEKFDILGKMPFCAMLSGVR